MTGIIVTLSPNQWGDVLQGLRELVKIPGISDDRREEITALGKQVRAQVDLCHVEDEHSEAKRRDYDVVRPTCPPCDSTGRVPVLEDGVERWKLCPCSERRSA